MFRNTLILLNRKTDAWNCHNNSMIQWRKITSQWRRTWKSWMNQKYARSVWMKKHVLYSFPVDILCAVWIALLGLKIVLIAENLSCQQFEHFLPEIIDKYLHDDWFCMCQLQFVHLMLWICTEYNQIKIWQPNTRKSNFIYMDLELSTNRYKC